MRSFGAPSNYARGAEAVTLFSPGVRALKQHGLVGLDLLDLSVLVIHDDVSI